MFAAVAERQKTRNAVLMAEDLFRKYGTSGPRYTSYPTAPAFQGSFGEADYRRALAAGRGPLSLYVHLPFCRSVCWFCACSVIYTNNQKRVLPYLELLEQEATLIAATLQSNRKVREMHWGGGTPTFLQPEEMIRLTNGLRKRFDFADDARLGIELDPRATSMSHIQALSECGFNRASVGVQDFALEVQRAVNRVQPFVQTQSLIAELRRRDFRELNIDLMYGLPHQTRESMLYTMARVAELRPDRISLFHFAYLPDLKKHQRNIRPESLPNVEERADLFEVAAQELAKAGYVHVGMDHFALPDSDLVIAQKQKRLRRNFQGYVPDGDLDLIGLGATSIGRPCPQAFAQNVKALPKYRELLEAGRLPIERGLWLTPDDELRAYVIQELICNFELNFAEVESRFDVSFEQTFGSALDGLAEFAEDGLVRLGDRHIEVTRRGRFFVRNICMLFDAYLEGQRAAGRSFSKTI